MAYWILKTEPSAYSFDDLVREGRTVWDGVKNPVALRNIGQMKSGDEVLIYHTGKEKAVVGRAGVAGAPYPDPNKKDARLLVVPLVAGAALPRPVTLAQIKGDPAFKDLALVRQGRLSVAPAPAAVWKRLLSLGGA